jgi:hypothetical protein
LEYFTPSVSSRACVYIPSVCAHIGRASNS